MEDASFLVDEGHAVAILDFPDLQLPIVPLLGLLSLLLGVKHAMNLLPIFRHTRLPDSGSGSDPKKGPQISRTNHSLYPIPKHTHTHETKQGRCPRHVLSMNLTKSNLNPFKYPRFIERQSNPSRKYLCSVSSFNSMKILRDLPRPLVFCQDVRLGETSYTRCHASTANDI